MSAFEDAGSKTLPHFLGHRERLKERFREGGAEAMPDYELLEMLLFRAIKRGDTKPLAKQLLARFGTFAEVLSADPERLMEVHGVGEAVATEIKIVHAAAMRLMRGQVINRPLLNTWNSILDYVKAAMAFHNIEQFRILFLDKKNQLIADEVQQAWHRRPHARLSARGGEAGAGTGGLSHRAGAQPSLGRPDAVHG